ncbi:MAG TPA: glycosyltransferase family 39 protein [Blastococcus sp.]|jgi:4-amino-4-deoxy-L-arabinose transferase-like glycosyltransferase|nr:glycosyltransferase family 39 protein [Blastococcus sp.]
MPALARGRALDLAARAALLVGSGVLYLVGLGRNGWGNSFYAGAVQAGAHNWTAMFFGSSDAGNSITVDKPPASLWVMEVSVRLFGLNSWSVLVPQALMGVATVALLMAGVRRVLGPGAGLLAGLLFALTPVATVLFRYDNPDALMTLLLVAAAYATTRALEEGRTRWVVLTGTFLGLAFLTKSLQAFLVLPALASILVLAAPGTLRRRLLQLLAGGAAMVVAGGWWFGVVALIPRADRPWVGGSTNDSPLDLALGYNGLGRLLGEKSPSGQITVPSGSMWRLFGSAGDQVAWLLPAAVVALVAAYLLVRRAGRTDPVRAAVLMWGGWAVVTALVLSVMKGIWHAYYTVELAPALAALVAIGATLLWRRDTSRARAVLAAGSLLTTAWAVSLVARRLHLVNGVAIAVALLGVAAVVLLRVVPARPAGRRVVAGLLVAAAVLGPATWSWASVLRPHTGASIYAGPSGHSVFSPRVKAVAPPASHEALALLRTDAHDWTWTAAAIGHRADDLQLAVGAPVMPVGGFAGHDPAPTLTAFKADVAAHRVHWFVAGATGSATAASIDAWVRRVAPAVHAGTTTLYDLSAVPAGGQG